MAPEQTTCQRLASGRQTGNQDRPYGRVPVPDAAGIRLGFAVELAAVVFDKELDE